MWRRVLKPRVSVRVLMGLVVLFAIAYTPVLIMIEPYRKEWQGEQRAIAAIRETAGHGVDFSTEPVGPLWLRRLAWGQLSYFDRVKRVYFVGGRGIDEYLARRSAFHHVGLVVSD